MENRSFFRSHSLSKVPLDYIDTVTGRKREREREEEIERIEERKPIDKLEREERGLSWTTKSKNRKSTRGLFFQSMKVRRMRERWENSE